VKHLPTLIDRVLDRLDLCGCSIAGALGQPGVEIAAWRRSEEEAAALNKQTHHGPPLGRCGPFQGTPRPGYPGVIPEPTASVKSRVSKRISPSIGDMTSE
jgi:hypothetical protein